MAFIIVKLKFIYFFPSRSSQTLKTKHACDSSLLIESMRSDVNSAIKPSICNTNAFKGLILEKNIHWFSKQVVIRKDIVLGQGMFGKCFYGSFGPVEACIRVLRPCHDNEIFIHEANMMSSLCHSNVTYLHGVCLDGKYNILLLSYHGIKFESHTIHSALFSEKSTGLTWTGNQY